ncbi:hypothetical protein NL533_31575, partial [Klebsiella pneumoniae]|nr:hypothetical protein [Klebsiella pneumoniae]
REEWASLPFGRVCQAVFQLRTLMFGPAMPCVISCPNCGERLEFRFECRCIPAPDENPVITRQIELGGRTIEIRLPTASDLLEAQSAADL